jgi:hypothetical protein
MKIYSLAALTATVFGIAPVQASLMSVEVGTVIYTNPLAPQGGAFRFNYQYDDSVSAVTTTTSTFNAVPFSSIALGPGYGRIASGSAGQGSFTGSLTRYGFDLTLTGTQAASRTGPGFVSTPSQVPAGAANRLTLNVLLGQATYIENGTVNTSSYGCILTVFSGSVDIQNQFGNTVLSRLGSEANVLGGPGNRIMCLDGYAFNPDATTQNLFFENASRIMLATERLRFSPNFNANVFWSGNQSGSVPAFSASLPVVSSEVPMPQSLFLSLIGLAGLLASKYDFHIRKKRLPI